MMDHKRPYAARCCRWQVPTLQSTIWWINTNRCTNKEWTNNLHQSCCSLETHDSDRLPLASSWQPVEGGAGAGKGAEGGGAGRDGSLRDTEAVYLFHQAEGSTPSQGVDDLCARTGTHTHTHSVLVHSSFFILICHATNNNKQRATHKWKAGIIDVQVYGKRLFILKGKMA